MSKFPMDEKECQQDTLHRIHNWLNVLEQRTADLLHVNEPTTLKPGEREQAISRHLLLILRLLQVRQQYAQASPSAGEQALLDALLRDFEDD